MPDNDITTLIRQAVESKVSEIIEAESKDTQRRIESKVRAAVPQIAAQVLEHFSMYRDGRELVIRVDFENGRKQGV